MRSARASAHPAQRPALAGLEPAAPALAAGWLPFSSSPTSLTNQDEILGGTDRNTASLLLIAHF